MMKHVVFFWLVALVSANLVQSAIANEAKEPLPVPTNVRVAPAGARNPIWEQLSHQEKQLGFHLIEAARAGRLILFFHNHRHAPVIKRFIETIFSKQNIEDTKAQLGQEAFTELLSYSAKFEDLAGPYEASNRKYALRKVTKAQLENLFKIYAADVSTDTRREAIELMADAHYELTQMPDDETGAGLENTGGNFYEKGVTGAEVVTAIENGTVPRVNCLNCRIVRSPTGGLRVEVQTVNTPGLVGEALRKTVRELRLAVPYATTPRQKTQFELLIRFFEEGNLEDFRQYNIEWVRDGHSSRLDFMMGFVEVYQDFRAQIGSWESYVQIVDPTNTNRSIELARNAQYFENKMPYGQFKKTFPADYAPPALMVYYFQEISSMHSGGYNLPNFDDIRRDVGAKNVIRLSLPGDDHGGAASKIRREYLEEFMPLPLVDRAASHMDASWQVLVLLHEIIGHGSGTYDVSKYGEKVDPVSALGTLGSALEEQRADLTALVFANDPKLIEVGIYKDQSEATMIRDVMYDTYLSDFLRHVSKERTLSESHQRGNWLLVNLLIEKGAAGWIGRDGKSAAASPDEAVLRVVDYEKFQSVSASLLEELQRIKANRDEPALKNLFTEKAPLDAIGTPWAKAVIRRGEKLAINAGSVEQPWRVSRDGKFRTLCESLLLEDVAQQWHRQ